MSGNRIAISSLISDMKALGIREGDTLLVHSAMKSLGGEVEGGCAGVIDALLTVLGESGTLLMPSLSYTTVTKEHPFFSAAQTPSCVGKLSEAFRSTPGVFRSIHPTHSVCAYGRLAEKLTAEHLLDTTPVGPHSPFRRIMDYSGKILMLGCGLEPNTFMHGVEEFIGVPYVLSHQTINFECELTDGTRFTAAHFPHLFTDVTQRYDRVAPLLSGEELVQGKIAQADCYLLDANALWNKAGVKMKESPFFFIDYHPQSA